MHLQTLQAYVPELQFTSTPIQKTEELISYIESSLLNPLQYTPYLSSVTGAARTLLGVACTVQAIFTSSLSATTMIGGYVLNKFSHFFTQKMIVPQDQLNNVEELAKQHAQWACALIITRVLRGILEIVPCIGNVIVYLIDLQYKNYRLLTQAVSREQNQAAQESSLLIQQQINLNQKTTTIKEQGRIIADQREIIRSYQTTNEKQEETIKTLQRAHQTDINTWNLLKAKLESKIATHQFNTTRQETENSRIQTQHSRIQTRMRQVLGERAQLTTNNKEQTRTVSTLQKTLRQTSQQLASEKRNALTLQKKITQLTKKQKETEAKRKKLEVQVQRLQETDQTETDNTELEAQVQTLKKKLGDNTSQYERTIQAARETIAKLTQENEALQKQQCNYKHPGQEHHHAYNTRQAATSSQEQSKEETTATSQRPRRRSTRRHRRQTRT